MVTWSADDNEEQTYTKLEDIRAYVDTDQGLAWFQMGSKVIGKRFKHQSFKNGLNFVK